MTHGRIGPEKRTTVAAALSGTGVEQKRSDLLLRPLRACRWTDRAERSRLTGRFLQRLSQGKIYPATPGQGMAPVGQWRYPVKRKP
jgi:hypothetical protein